MGREVVASRPKPAVVSYSVRGEKRVEDEMYERVLENGHKWGFPEPKPTTYTPPPPAKPEPPEPVVPWWKNFCDPRWLLSVRGACVGVHSGVARRALTAKRACDAAYGCAAGCAALSALRALHAPPHARPRRFTPSWRAQCRSAPLRTRCCARALTCALAAVFASVAASVCAAAGAAAAHPAAALAAGQEAGRVPRAGLQGRAGGQVRHACSRR
jgi:hypothetical protein